MFAGYSSDSLVNEEIGFIFQLPLFFLYLLFALGAILSFSGAVIAAIVNLVRKKRDGY